MATLAQSSGSGVRDEKFVARIAIAMAVVAVLGFSNQYLQGRSTFASPIRVHAHAVAFTGWVALFVAQSQLATRGSIELHRRLGWVAVGWMALMVATSLIVIVEMTRNGHVPFFFVPQQLLIGNPLTVLNFVVLTSWAIAWRHRTDWHARLHVCGMTAIIGPAIGRLLPMPLLTPYAFEISNLAVLIFPAIGMLRDLRFRGAVHPAWWCGVAAVVATVAISDLIVYSTLGDAFYKAVVAGSPGASVPGLAYPLPPAGSLMTGR